MNLIEHIATMAILGAHAAKIVKASYRLAVGAVADIVILDAIDHRSPIR